MIGEIHVIVTERSERGERLVGVAMVVPGDTIHLNDDMTRDGGPSPIIVKYHVTGELELIVWSQEGKR